MLRLLIVFIIQKQLGDIRCSGPHLVESRPSLQKPQKHCTIQIAYELLGPIQNQKLLQTLVPNGQPVLMTLLSSNKQLFGVRI